MIKHGAAAAVSPAGARAAEYPERTVDLVIPYAAGGGIDLLLRVMAKASRRTSSNPSWSPTAPAQAARIGVAYVARSAPDGYTLLFVPALAYSVLPLMQSNVGYTDKSFAPICRPSRTRWRLSCGPNHPSRPRATSSRPRARRTASSYAATAVGTITHLAAAALADAAKVKFNHVPFRGDGDLMGQLIGGHVDFASVTLASAAAAGPSVRVIGIFAEARNPSLPGRAHRQGAGLRRRADELRRAVCAGRRAGRRAGQARHWLQVRGGAAGLRQTWPSDSTRARTTTPMPRPSPSGSTPTWSTKKQLLQRVGLIK